MKCAYHPEVDAIGSCVNCGKLICAECRTTLGGKIYCQPCADTIFAKPAERPVAERPVEGRAHWAWWLMPIFLTWVGGLIAWLVNRDTDPGTARNMLILGLVLTAAWILLWVGFTCVAVVTAAY